MKKLLTILFFCILGLQKPLYAQDNTTIMQTDSSDLIITVDGDMIPALVVLVGDSEIQYKKMSNLSGPTYTLKTGNIFMIKYKNGEKDLFKRAGTAVDENNVSFQEPVMVEVPVSDDNQFQISLYNKYYGMDERALRIGQKNTNGIRASNHEATYGITTSSVISNSDILVSIRKEICDFNLFVHNKTDRIIYIDMANCFSGGTCLYDGSATLQTEGKGAGAGVNLGAVSGALGIGGALGTLSNGVTVGGGGSSSTTTIQQEQRFKAIPPHETVLIQSIFISSGIKSETLEKGKLNNYTEQTSPFTKKILITYSSKPSFQIYSQVAFTLYLKQTMGFGIQFYPWLDEDDYFLEYI